MMPTTRVSILLARIVAGSVLVVFSSARAPAAPMQATCQPGWMATQAPPLDGSVASLFVFDDGSGPALYAGGSFTNAGSVAANHIARWNGTSWSALGAGFDAPVVAMCAFDSGSGPELYAAGGFVTSGTTTVNGIARWDGTSWLPLGTGVASTLPSPFGPYVLTLQVLHSQFGQDQLFVGGAFTHVNGVHTPCSAIWDGTTWAPSFLGSQGPLHASTVFTPPGAGAPVYAAGGDVASFHSAYVVEIAGGAWQPPPLVSSLYGIFSLCGFDDGHGVRLFAGSAYGSLEQVSAWDGSAWVSLNGGLSGSAFPAVYALQPFDDGSGAKLFAGGSFTDASGVTTSNIARWDGTVWSAVGTGLSAPVRALAVYDDGHGAGPSLFAGGDFTNAAGTGDSYLARFGCPPVPPLAFCAGDGSGTACPCGNDAAAGSHAGCLNSLGLGAALGASGTPSFSSDSLVLFAHDMPSSTGLFFQGTSLVAGGSGASFGDGLRCAGGTTVRLGTKAITGGAAQYPGAGDASISVRGGVLPGDVRSYQMWYRNAAAFCTSATFNLTNGIELAWVP